ncbi:MAG TPA: ATP-binding protein [Vicinamibacterales bacterium]|nr:ATP-binding protein [Vicinamibacterales bacterium]
MRIASSLTNRVFLACTLLATLSLGFAFYFVNERASAAAEAELRRGLVEAGSLVDQYGATRTDQFTRLARVVADLPKLKAAVETGDPPTVQPLADEYREEINADLLLLTGRGGRVLGSAGADAVTIPALDDVHPTEEMSTVMPHGRGVLQLVSVPILLEGALPEILGRLTVGFFLDDRRAVEFKGLTGSEIAFGAGGRILASTLPPEARATLARVMSTSTIASVTLGDEEYLALARPLQDAGGPGAPVALILRSRTERLQFLNTIRTGLAGALIATLLLATLLSYGVALTMTRPLAAITTAMRDVAATGDLTRKVTLKSRALDDEDARTLAAAFNTLTESIARFQREAAQKERLSSLGRLSTVIAHEIRNPLMIIRASLATLRHDRVTASELREAVADIDEETTRLNRIVTEVLDFARPIRFELADADVNEICRASVEAAWTGEASSAVALDLDPSIGLVVTDAERLRTALVNVLTNARHAVLAAAARRDTGTGRAAVALAVAEEPAVRLQTRAGGGRIVIAIHDRGIGIAPEDMPRIFDPYFTTRRAGTGLGLPLVKNIIEGLGGTLNVSSHPGEGTAITLELPQLT